jgi:uncharacterized protein with von Willebrand factor type A (vWA) domain
LRFTQALAASAVHTDAFVFGTKLTRVTRLLRGRDRNAALRRVADATTELLRRTRLAQSWLNSRRHSPIRVPPDVIAPFMD